MQGPAPGMNKLRALWRKQRIPYSLFFELTPRCTFDCRMCYIHLTPEQMGDRQELPTEEWLRIVDRALREGMLYCVLTGGECMLHPGFWEIYERILDGGTVLSVNTNAWALTDADIARFVAHPPAGIRITLYGASEETYERVTGRRAFGRVVENIRKLRAAGLNVMLAATLCRENLADFPQMMLLARELGLRLRYTFALDAPYDDTGRKLEDILVAPEEIAAAELAGWRAMGFAPAANEALTELPSRLPDDPGYAGMRCNAGRGGYAVLWDGRFSPCLCVPTALRVGECGYEELWAGAKEMVERYPLPVECRDCRLRPICIPCPLTRQLADDPGHCDPYRCRVTIARYNAGTLTLKPRGKAEPAGDEADPGEVACED